MKRKVFLGSLLGLFAVPLLAVKGFFKREVSDNWNVIKENGDILKTQWDDIKENDNIILNDGWEIDNKGDYVYHSKLDRGRTPDVVIDYTTGKVLWEKGKSPLKECPYFPIKRGYFDIVAWKNIYYGWE